MTKQFCLSELPTDRSDIELQDVRRRHNYGTVGQTMSRYENQTPSESDGNGNLPQVPEVYIVQPGQQQHSYHQIAIHAHKNGTLRSADPTQVSPERNSTDQSSENGLSHRHQELLPPSSCVDQTSWQQPLSSPSEATAPQLTLAPHSRRLSAPIFTRTRPPSTTGPEGEGEGFDNPVFSLLSERTRLPSKANEKHVSFDKFEFIVRL